MATAYNNRQEAARAFLCLLIDTSLDGVVRSMRHILEDGPAGRNPPQERLHLHGWFQGLSPSDREMVVRVVQESARSSVFETLVLLDGLTGGRWREGRILDLGLYLEVFPENDSEPGAEPEITIRLNSRSGAVQDLHEMFQEIMETHHCSRDDQAGADCAAR